MPVSPGFFSEKSDHSGKHSGPARQKASASAGKDKNTFFCSQLNALSSLSFLIEKIFFEQVA